MLSADEPLNQLTVPWEDLASRTQPSSLDEVAQTVARFHQVNAARIPAFDERQRAVFPPDEHILDDLCRRYDLVDSAIAERHPGPGTCAVVGDLPQCDRCTAFARYETVSGQSGVLCESCFSLDGREVLAPGESVLLLHFAEVPHTVRTVADELCRSLDREEIWGWSGEQEVSWRRKLRGLGFAEGPRDDTMEAWLFGTLVKVVPDGSGFKVSAFRRDDRIWILPHEGTTVPGEADTIEIGQAVRSLVDTQSWTWGRRLERVLKPPTDHAVARALNDVQQAQYQRYCDWQEMWDAGWRGFSTTIHAAQWAAAEVAATESEDPSVLEQLALKHPDPDVRGLAVGNPHCPDAVIVKSAAEDRAWQTRRAVEGMTHAPVGAIDALTLSVLTNGLLDIYLALDLYLRSDCPERFESALLDRLVRQAPAFRVSAAWWAHGADPHRRDRLHSALLHRARRIPFTVDLLDAVLGETGLSNADRITWLIGHGDPSVASVARHYLQDLDAPMEGRLAVALSPPGGAESDSATGIAGSPSTTDAAIPWWDSRLAYAEDSVRTRAYRRLQSRWREDALGLEPGTYTSRSGVTRRLGSLLPLGCGERDQLLSDEAVAYARARLPEIDAEGRGAEPTRLWRNMLSSQPLCFSLFGHLDAHRDAAARVLDAVLPWQIDSVERILVEHAPPSAALRLGGTAPDKTAFDAMLIAWTRGVPLLLGVETKYTEPFSPTEYDKTSYRTVSGAEQTWFLPNVSSIARGSATNQLWRNLMLAQESARDLDCEGAVVVLTAANDPHAEAAVSGIRPLLREPDRRLVHVLLEDVMEAATQEEELTSWAHVFTERYLDLRLAEIPPG